MSTVAHARSHYGWIGFALEEVPMIRCCVLAALATLLFLGSSPPLCWSFSFSQQEQEDASDAPPEHHRQSLSQLKCPKSLKSATIASMIGEIHRSGGGGRNQFYGSFMGPDAPEWHSSSTTNKSVYGNLVDALNVGFQQLGLKTYTSAEINARIARAEQEAVLNNDPDAAIAAADRLSASFMLKGVISTRSQLNRVVNVDEVYVTIDLSLVDRQGRQIASAQISETTFSDADVLNTIHNLVKKQAPSITYTLFKDYCQGGK